MSAIKNRCVIQLPDIDYQTSTYPIISNTITDLPESFKRYGTEKGQHPFHCFVDDWKLEGIWRHKYKQVEKAINARYVIAPDFTIETDTPLFYAQYQVWRSRLIGRYWQDHGVYVIPCLQWSRREINYQLFSWLHNAEVVAVRSPTRGTEPEWIKCAEQFLSVRRPKLVLHFGTKNGIDVWPNAINMNLR